MARCTHFADGRKCGYSKDVSLECAEPAERVISLRLVSKSGNATAGLTKGRLEAQVDGEPWGLVCKDGFSQASAVVRRRSLSAPTEAPTGAL